VRRVASIALSEFLTAVRARGFLIGIVLMPLLLTGAVALQRFIQREADRREYRVAVIDDTGAMFDVLSEAAHAWNRGERDASPPVHEGPQFILERVDPSSAARPALRLTLSNRVRAQSLFAFVELPPRLLAPDAEETIRYYSAAPSYRDLPSWLQRAVLKEVVRRRFEMAHLSPLVVASLLKPVRVEELGLVTPRADGQPGDARVVDRTRVAIIPIALMLLLFIIVVMTTPALLHSVLEEKMSRITEVLLGSVTPFQLMLGKLLASTAVSLVMMVVYLTGAAWTVREWGYLDAIDVTLVLWFVLFLVMAMLTYGAIFIAIGSACSDLHDAQHMMTPAMILLMLPGVAWPIVAHAPQSALSVAISLTPPAAPFLMLLRLALPEPPPTWQALASVGLSMLAMLAIVWAAGRVVRTGLLMQGKGITLGEMWRWIWT
jgi:ABC-2 type transport system permease protein